MFIKILTPNHNGKIELTVKDLEALIQEAVDKAIREKCAGCTRIWYNTPSITLLGNQQLNNNEPQWDPYKVTCTGNPVKNDEMTITFDCATDAVLTTNNNDNFTTMVNALANEKFNNNKRGNN